MESPPTDKTAQPTAHQIQLNLRDVNQLFNTMDPSPFHEKDLDGDAEEFIVNWAQEFPLEEEAVLVVHLGESSDGVDAQKLIEEAVHHYFSYRAKLNQMEFRKLMREGRQSLLIGIAFLAICLFVSELLARATSGTFAGILRESLTIGGWVAMWRPLEIYLYDWWPLLGRGRVYEKLSKIRIEVRKAKDRTAMD